MKNLNEVKSVLKSLNLLVENGIIANLAKQRCDWTDDSD